MNQPNCCLTLIFPKALEENMVDLLLEHAALASGFTTVEVDGHGRNIAYQSTTEKVRGRAHRIEMQVVLNQDDAQILLRDIKQALPNTDIVYWISPVIEFGSLI